MAGGATSTQLRTSKRSLDEVASPDWNDALSSATSALAARCTGKKKKACGKVKFQDVKICIFKKKKCSLTPNMPAHQIVPCSTIKRKKKCQSVPHCTYAKSLCSLAISASPTTSPTPTPSNTDEAIKTLQNQIAQLTSANTELTAKVEYLQNENAKAEAQVKVAEKERDNLIAVCTCPTNSPTHSPTNLPTNSPTELPTTSPTNVPTNTPTTKRPTNSPTVAPTVPPSPPTTPSPTYAPTETLKTDKWCKPLALSNFEYPKESEHTERCKEMANREAHPKWGAFCDSDMSLTECPGTCDATTKIDSIVSALEKALPEYADEVDLIKWYMYGDVSIGCYGKKWSCYVNGFNNKVSHTLCTPPNSIIEYRVNGFDNKVNVYGGGQDENDCFWV